MPQSASRHQSTSVRRGRTDVRQANTVGFHILRTESGSGRGGWQIGQLLHVSGWPGVSVSGGTWLSKHLSPTQPGGKCET